MHRERVGSETQGCVIVGVLEPFCGQAVNETVGSRMNDVGEQQFRRGRTKKSAKGFYY